LLQDCTSLVHSSSRRKPGSILPPSRCCGMDPGFRRDNERRAGASQLWVQGKEAARVAQGGVLRDAPCGRSSARGPNETPHREEAVSKGKGWHATARCDRLAVRRKTPDTQTVFSLAHFKSSIGRNTMNTPAYRGISRRRAIQIAAAGAIAAPFVARRGFAAGNPTVVNSIRSLTNPYHATWNKG